MEKRSTELRTGWLSLAFQLLFVQAAISLVSAIVASWQARLHEQRLRRQTCSAVALDSWVQFLDPTSIVNVIGGGIKSWICTMHSQFEVRGKEEEKRRKGMEKRERGGGGTCAFVYE